MQWRVINPLLLRALFGFGRFFRRTRGWLRVSRHCRSRSRLGMGRRLSMGYVLLARCRLRTRCCRLGFTGWTSLFGPRCLILGSFVLSSLVLARAGCRGFILSCLVLIRAIRSRFILSCLVLVRAIRSRFILGCLVLVRASRSRFILGCLVPIRARCGGFILSCLVLVRAS